LRRRSAGGLGIFAGVLKVMLISVVLATFLLPAVTATGKRPLSALRATLVAILLAELVYAFFLRFVYDRLA
jgi:Ca2+/H+ antiporter